MRIQNTMFAGMLVLGGLAAGPAIADCAADIKAVQESAAQASDATKKAEAEKHLTEAQSHLDMGHEDVCQNHVTMARSALEGGASGTPRSDADSAGGTSGY